MKANVLVVDDDLQVLKALKRTLSLENTVFAASTIKEALSVLEKEKVDLIISDYRLEGEIGTELLEEVYGRWPHITRITITGFRNTEIIEESVNKASIFRFITKPWNNEELLQTVRDAKHRTDILRENIKTIKTIKAQEEQINKEIEILKNSLKLKDLNLYNKTEELAVLERELHNTYELLERFANSSFNMEEFKEYILSSLRELVGIDEVEIRIDLNLDLRKPVIVNKDFIVKYDFLDMEFDSALLYPLELDVKNHKVCWFFVFLKKQGVFVHNDLEKLNTQFKTIKLVLEWALLFDYVRVGEKQWDDIFNTISDPIVISDLDNKILKFNTEASKFLKANFEHFKPNAFTSNDFEYSRYTVESGQQNLHYFRNIRREKELYRQLVQSEKLGAIGMLASNIAHELNNPIGGIMAYSQLLKDEKKYSGIRDELENIEDACKRAKNIVYNLLDFSDDKKRQELKTVFLDELVRDTLPLLTVCLKGFDFSVSVPEGISISCRVGELQQVLFNLIVNATHAIDIHGRIRVEGGDNEQFVFFSVEDNGTGISDDIKDKIFDSFFTTKGKAKGTGLGLSVAKSIVEKHGGYIELFSKEGQGTKFTVYIPKG